MVRELAYKQENANNALVDSKGSRQHLGACGNCADWQNKKSRDSQGQEKACRLVDV